jgi:hypothetical protein
MKCGEFLTLREDGMYIAPKFRAPSPVSPFVLNGFANDTELRVVSSEYIHSANILVMPVHYSPLLAYLVFRPPWIYRYTDSLKMLSMLWSIIQCYSVVDYPQKNAKRIDEARRELMLGCEELNEKIVGGGDFIRAMESFTIDRIRLHEACIWKMFGYGFPVEIAQTPHVTPPLSVLDKATQDQFPAIIKHFYETKDFLVNVRLEKAQEQGAYQAVRHFTCLDEGFGENPYNGYLSHKFAREYHIFLSQ